MLSHPILKVLLAAWLAWSAWGWITHRPIHPPDGVLAAADPQQENLESAPITVGRWQLTPRAHYSITARVLGSERYRFDSLADLIPEDLALGWGPMSDNRVLRDIDISQSGRFYFWRATAEPPIDVQSIIEHSANTHLIPADTLVARQLSRVRVGEVVTLQGDLVDGTRDDGHWIKTSLVRSDSGAGACEVLLVREVNVQR